MIIKESFELKIYKKDEKNNLYLFDNLKICTKIPKIVKEYQKKLYIVLNDKIIVYDIELKKIENIEMSSNIKDISIDTNCIYAITSESLCLY